MQKKKELSAAAIVTLVVVAVAGLGAIGLFGWQTWEFVDFLLPKDLLLMKILAVTNFDGFSYIWLAMSLFVGAWLQSTSKKFCTIAGIIDLILSLTCSVIQMMIADAERFLTAINPNLIYFANAIIVLALVINIVTLLSLVHIEWPYISKEKSRETVEAQSTPALSTTSVQQLPQHFMSSEEERYEWLARQQLITERQQQEHQARLEAARVRILAEQRQSQTQSPLQQPPLPTQASQPGNQNGVH